MLPEDESVTPRDRIGDIDFTQWETNPVSPLYTIVRFVTSEVAITAKHLLVPTPTVSVPRCVFIEAS
jgi:hypothetical protein